MTVGSTNTIIYSLYRESKTDIPYDIAGLMISGILSDTLALTSPTTTSYDKEAVTNLSKLLGIDYKEYATDMFKAGTSLEGRTKEDIIGTDIKIFPVNGKKIAISQVFTMNYEEILDVKEDYIKILEDMKKNRDYDLILLCITDIMQNGSYILYSKDDEENISLSLGIDDISEGYFLPGVVSRKKQIVPNIMSIIK